MQRGIDRHHDRGAALRGDDLGASGRVPLGQHEQVVGAWRDALECESAVAIGDRLTRELFDEDGNAWQWFTRERIKHLARQRDERLGSGGVRHTCEHGGGARPDEAVQ